MSSPALPAIEGVIPILQTPFHESGELDLDSLRREVNFVCEAGAQGVAFPGFASEWWKLSETEILQAAEAVLAARKGSVRVVFNVTAQSTFLAVKQAKRFVALGCDALMCLPPFVVPPGPEAVIRHLCEVMAAAEVPHIVQYSASLTGIQLNIDDLVALKRAFPHFSCIKVDFIPPGPVISQLTSVLQGEPFTYLIGYAGLQLPDALRRGAHGFMGGAGHIVEDLAVFRTLREPGTEKGEQAFAKLLPLLNFEMQTIDMSIAVNKRFLRDQGIIASDYVRAPGARLDKFQEEELTRHKLNLKTIVRQEVA